VVFSNLSSVCQNCSQLITGCITCNSSSTCTLCQSPDYTLVNGKCILDNQSLLNCFWPYCATCNTSTCITYITGFIFWQGQCKKANNNVGCVVYTVDNLGNLICSNCDTALFFAIPVNNICVCKSGILQNEVCTTDIGCVNAYLNNNVISCRFCNFAANYQPTPVNGVCQCLPYYALNQFSKCDDSCGDGRIMTNSYLYCDDGNQISGDGCSSTCSI